MEMLPDELIQKRSRFNSPDEVWIYEKCSLCDRKIISRSEVNLPRENQSDIDNEIPQKKLVFQILRGDMNSVLNVNRCSCSPELPKCQLYQIVFCAEKDLGYIDKHYYLDFINKTIQEVEYGRNFEFDLENLIDSLDLDKAYSPPTKQKPHYIFLDTETTGLPLNYTAPVSNSANWPRLVQLCWAEYDLEGNQINIKDYIIKPSGFIIPKSSERIHKISQEKAVREGVELPIVLKNLLERIKGAEVLVGHNVEFDLNILGAELHRLSYENPFKSKTKICTMKTTVDFCAIINSYGYKYPTLEELHKKVFNTTFSNMHNAQNDTMATAKCFWELKKRNFKF